MGIKSNPASLDTHKDIEKYRTHNPENAPNIGKREMIDSRASGRDARISKTVRMRLRFSEMLRDESYRQTREKGSKVSEADILDEALNDWKLKHGILTD